MQNNPHSRAPNGGRRRADPLTHAGLGPEQYPFGLWLMITPRDYPALPTADPLRALNILREAAGLQPLSEEDDDQGGDDRGGIG
jgi:hypothetical protein